MTKLVNEISSELIARYKEKAKTSADELEGKKQFRKATTRRMGIFRATGKQIEKTTANIKKALNKEEVEQIDELSTDTLKSYHTKANQDMKTKGEKLGMRAGTKKDWKRIHGMETAKSKMYSKGVDPFKEEVEELDEISSMAHAKYRDAARKNIKQTMREPLSPNAAERINKRVKGLSTSTALEYIKSKTKKGSNMAEAVHPMGLHVSMTNQKKNGLPAYKVHAVGKHISDQIKVGEHLNDTELDDAQDAGIKVKHIKEDAGAKPLANILEMAKRGRPRKTENRPAAKKSEDDEEEDYGPDVGPEADQNITVHLKKTLDNEKHETNFSDGKKHVVPQHIAHTVLHGMMKLKPEQRKQVQDHIQLSHKNLMDVHSILKGK